VRGREGGGKKEGRNEERERGKEGNNSSVQSKKALYAKFFPCGFTYMEIKSVAKGKRYFVQ
jgi:hypothetical protein